MIAAGQPGWRSGAGRLATCPFATCSWLSLTRVARWCCQRPRRQFGIIVTADSFRIITTTLPAVAIVAVRQGAVSFPGFPVCLVVESPLRDVTLIFRFTGRGPPLVTGEPPRPHADWLCADITQPNGVEDP